MSRSSRLRSTRVVAVTAASGLALAAVTSAATTASASPAAQVLRVGSWHGVAGNEPSIDAAVAALRPGGWLLIGPGDWHPRMDYQHDQLTSKYPAAVLVTAADAHVRGMDRNTVILDGTRPGSTPCSSAPAAQDFGPLDASHQPRGRNGIEALDTSGVHFENLTACNFLHGSADSGNEIWWNGGDDGGRIGLHSYGGDYISATSTYYDPAHPDTAAAYGVFVSNADGPGLIDHSYASNVNDGAYYVGACPNCNLVVTHAHAENSALGWSGTNAGGHEIIEYSEFDDNKTGFVTNSQNSADPPSPQNGACPGTQTGPTGTHDCWVFQYNYVHDNNNPDVPESGDAALGPPGNGITIAGGRNDVVTHNRFVHNGSWGVLVTIFPDTGGENPNNPVNCDGGVAPGVLPAALGGQTVPCLYDAWGNEVADNTFSRNGFYGNPTNGDIADLTVAPAEAPGAPGDCYHGNTDSSGTVSTWPATLQSTQGTCGQPVYPDPASTTVLAAEVSCATQAFFTCPSSVPAAAYPRQGRVVMKPLPPQATMPDPCAGVPANPWCPAAAAVTPSRTAAAPRRGTIAFTGAPPWVAAGGVALLAVALLAARRRRPLR